MALTAWMSRLPSSAHQLLFDRSKPARLSIGMARIGLATALLWTLWRYHLHFSTFGGIVPYAESYEGGKFYAFGVMQLWGGNPPSPDFLLWTMRVTIVAAFLSLVGLLSRPATIIAVLGVLLLTSWKEGSYPYWSHGFNVVCLAGLAFMAGQSGASLSIDRWLTKRFPSYPLRAKTSLGYWWPVAAGQAAIALFYFGAGVAKQINGGMWDWVFSDNLRFSLAVTWYGYEYYDVPWYIEKLMNTQWLWIAAAGGHLFTQFFPVLAVLHKDNPWLRLAEGVVYAGGVFLLHIVMTVWNPVWLPLAVFFVDWDWVQQKFSRASLPSPALGNGGLSVPATRMNALVVSSVYGFFAFYVATFTFQIAHKHLIYPFSDMDFYSDVRAKKPYNVHQPYDFYRGHVRVKLASCDPSTFEMAGDWQPPTEKKEIARRQNLLTQLEADCVDGWFTLPNTKSTYPEFYRIEDAGQMKGALETTATYLQRHSTYALAGLREVVIEKAIWVYPAYPNPAFPVAVHFGPRAYLDLETGEFKYVNSTYYRDQDSQELRLDLEIVGFVDPVVEVLYRHNVREVSAMPDLQAMDGKWSGPSRFIIDEKGGAWEKPAFTLYRITERNQPDGRVWEFWGADNLS